MARLTEKLIAGMLILFLLAYVGYQVYRATYSSIKTETVFDYTVSRSIPVIGIAIRSEILIDGSYSGIENYIFEDGTRVSVGESVAEFYESDQSDANLRHSRELEAEIKMLTEAQDTTVNNFSTTEILNRDIKEQLGYISQMSGHGRFDLMPAARERLTALINKKQIATGKAKSYENRIAKLRVELESLARDSGADRVTAAQAPVSGYFSRTVDGLEETVNRQATGQYGIGDYITLIEQEPPEMPGDKIGKIVTDQNWVFAVSAPKESLEFVHPGQEVRLRFESINKRIPAKVADIMQEKDDERAVLLLSCNQISAEIINLRKAQAVINFDQFTGLRVNLSDIRFQGAQRGVYILDGNTVSFKKIDPIYEESTFVLSRLVPPDSIDPDDRDFVSLFDQIVTGGGKDIYDGKVIL